MSVMLSLVSWFLLAMAAGGGLHANSATAEVTIASNSAAVTAYWHTMLPNTLMPSAILELLAPPAGNEVQNSKCVWGPSTPNDVEKINNGNWGPSTKAEDEKSNGVWDPSTTNDVMKNNGNWGPSTTNDVEKNNGNWGSSTRKDVQKSKGVWGSFTTNDVEKINNGNWGPSTKAEDEKSNGVWDPSTTNDVMKDNGNWGPSTTNDVEKNNGNWGSSTRKDVQKSKGVWGSFTTNDVEKINNGNWGPSTKAEDEKSNGVWDLSTTNDILKNNGNWGPSNKAEDQKNNGNSGSSTTNDIQKRSRKWGPSTKADDQNHNGNWAWGSSTKAEDQNHNGNWAWGSLDIQKSHGESHIGQDNHKHGTMSNMVFLEEALKPGSTIPCYIQPSATLGAPLLRRDVADSIPMSTGNFIKILTMFAPASNDMATKIWSTLDDCEHPRAIKGETKACVSSVESMVEFAASVLGVSTYNLAAFSSPDVPVDGVMTGRGYKVAAVTRVREAGDTMTCHRGSFPFAMFMCHAVNPTRVYSVTLEGEDVDADGAGQRMEVLAVCHLDTSDFHPAKMPLHVKPGDAPLCHFISRDSILWAPATPASAHAAA
ncbi:uncharacterized protein [Aegilops tauschii subsp. strangulata]|uniref:BURP domain-containing protein n=1 Tax=Aegilops tauschii subsp. strangulata TaxID=200361 RepID=A0A452XP36_AEGTS